MFLVHFNINPFEVFTQGHSGPFCHLRQGLFGPEILVRQDGVAGQDPDDIAVLLLLFELVEDRLDPHRLADVVEEAFAGDRGDTLPQGVPFAVHGQQPDAVHAAVEDVVLHRLFVVDVDLLLAIAHLEERRLGDVEVAPFDDLFHLTEKECEQKRPDMESVHVRIGHDDHLVVAEPADVLVLLTDPDADAEGGDDHPELFVLEHLVEARLFDVEHLASERQDRLVPTVPALLGGAAGRVPLDEVDLAPARIPLLAVRQFSGEGADLEGGLAPRQFAGVPGRFARPGRIQALAQQLLGDGGVFLHIAADLVVDDPLDKPLDLAVPEFRLRLTFELRVPDLDADHAGQTFAQVLALQGFLPVFQDVAAGGVVVERARQG